MNWIFKIFIFIILSTMIFGCSNCENCYCLEYNEKIIQSYDNGQYSATMIQTDDGAFGETCRLVICNTQDKFIEEIGLRGEVDIPRIDKIENNEVHVYYSYSNVEERVFQFEDVVLGEALLHKNPLKFNYHFENRKLK